ncbi:TIGR02301 family protein [Allorhizobium undicola]|uniref:TIGR02301 family protein n=1 Tax=Allorhizobium undicola TaxID=78527 RepID=UPI003D35992F
MKKLIVMLFAATGLMSATIPPTAVQSPVPDSAPTESPTATPYDSQLNRLAEVLGTVTYLRNLCGADSEPQWRASMEKLIEEDADNEPLRKEALTASFNRGYRAFAAVHTTCTSAARMAESQYRAEGATLVDEMTARFGN